MAAAPGSAMNEEGRAQLKHAVVGRRIVAALIDVVLVSVFLAILAAIFGDFGTTDDDGFEIRLDGAPFIFGTLASFAYFIYFEGSSGASLGKRAMGIKVVKADGRPAGYGSATIRTVLRVVDIVPFLYLLGLLVIAVTPKNQRVGDLAAGTLVVAADSGSESEASLAPGQATSEALRDLARLHSEGILTDEEYEDRRRRLVEQL